MFKKKEKKSNDIISASSSLEVSAVSLPRKAPINFLSNAQIPRNEIDLDKFLDEDFVAPLSSKPANFIPYAYNPHDERYRPSYVCRKLREYIEANDYPILAELMSREGWNKATLYRVANVSPYISHYIELLGNKKQIYLERNLLDETQLHMSKNLIAIWDRLYHTSEAGIARSRHAIMGECGGELYSESNTIINVSSGMSELDKKIANLSNSINLFYSKAQKVNPLYSQKLFLLLEGGRGGGKSFSAADIVIYKALTREKSGMILCGREIQQSLRNSSKYLIELRIAQYGLTDFFDITENEIRVKNKDVKIIFLGMRGGTREDTIKSLTEVFFFWGEEAQNFSQETIDKLIPTVIRNEDAQFVFTMNRTYENDPVYLELTSVRPTETLHIKINYYDNPFVPESIVSEAETMKVSNFAKWLHLYEGEPQTVFDNSLWSVDMIQSMRSPIIFDRSNYIEVVIACDPATTNKYYSNEYGIQVAGMTKYGEAHLIKDVSNHFSVNDFAQTAINAYRDFDADCLIVEVNNGGDFIKNTLLTIDPTLNIVEVRAKDDKVMRAKPVVNLAQMGKIKHIGGGSPTLESQMLRITETGFKGAEGESPDRVDAYVWANLHLFKLSSLDTTEVYIKSEYFPEAQEYNNSYILAENIGYSVIEAVDSGIILLDFIKDEDNRTMAVIKDYWKCKTLEYTACVQNLLQEHKFMKLFIQDDKFGNPIIKELRRFYLEPRPLFTSKFHKKKLEDKVIIALPYFQRKQIQIKKLPNKQFNSYLGNLFIDELTRYTPNVSIDRPLLNCILNLLFKEWDISEE